MTERDNVIAALERCGTGARRPCGSQGGACVFGQMPERCAECVASTVARLLRAVDRPKLAKKCGNCRHFDAKREKGVRGYVRYMSCCKLGNEKAVPSRYGCDKYEEVDRA